MKKDKFFNFELQLYVMSFVAGMAADNVLAKRLHTPEGTPPSHRTLTSPGHSSAILTTLRQLFRQEQLCDYTVIAEGQTFHTHRTVLAAVSDYFRAMLTGRWGKWGKKDQGGIYLDYKMMCSQV